MPELVDQPTSEPTRKTRASIMTGAVAAAASTLLTWALSTYTKVEVPAPIQVAVTTILMALAAYFTKEEAQ